jgi:hypothetical protein
VSLQSVFEWFTQGAIILLAALMVMQWARWRDRVSLDICLVFGSLAALLVLERSFRLAEIQAPWMRPLGVSVLLAHPYLLLRVVLHFRPVSRAFFRAATIGLLISLLVTWISEWPFESPILVVFSILYFIWLLSYVAYAFGRGATAAAGVTHCLHWAPRSTTTSRSRRRRCCGGGGNRRRSTDSSPSARCRASRRHRPDC